jgi:hydrogenase maturation protease
MTALVIGVGNEYRHDDGAGAEVVKRLRRRHLPGVTLALADGEPSRLVDLWHRADLAVVVDAVRTESLAPGTIHRLAITEAPQLGRPTASSHGLGLGEAIDLGLALGRLPHRLVVYAIEGADFSMGPGLSPPVRSRIGEVEHLVLDELAQVDPPSSAPGLTSGLSDT